MENQTKIFGWIFLALGLVNLIHPEWIDFGIFSAIGSGLLIKPEKSGAKLAVQIALMLTAFALVIVRLWMDINK